MTGPVVARGGARGLRDAVAALLNVELPLKIPLLRTAWSIDSDHLPDVDVITSGEAPDQALDTRGRSWIEVINPRLVTGPVRVDIDPAGRPVHRYRYSARIYVWALAQTWELALAARDNLCAATRLSLMEYPTLTKAGGDTGYLLHETTLLEEYGTPSRVNRRGGAGSPRVWAGGLLSYEINSEETTSDGSTRGPIGTADTVSTTSQAYGPRSGFPTE